MALVALNSVLIAGKYDHHRDGPGVSPVRSLCVAGGLCSKKVCKCNLGHFHEESLLSFSSPVWRVITPMLPGEAKINPYIDM